MTAHKFSQQQKRKTVTPDGVTVFLVEEGGFEPPKSVTTDLQSAPFGRSGTPPYELGAGGRIRTPDLLITNQLLYRLSYTSGSVGVLSNNIDEYIKGNGKCQAQKSEKIKKLQKFFKRGT